MAGSAFGLSTVDYSWQLGRWPFGPSYLTGSATVNWAASSSMDAQRSEASASIALGATVTLQEFYLNSFGSFYSAPRFKEAHLNSLGHLSSS